MEIQRFNYLFSDISLNFIELDGLVFTDRDKKGKNAMLKKISSYSSAKEAQIWINTILMENLIYELFEFDRLSKIDNEVKVLLQLFVNCWKNSLKIKFPFYRFSFRKIIDESNGDIGVFIKQIS